MRLRPARLARPGLAVLLACALSVPPGPATAQQQPRPTEVPQTGLSTAGPRLRALFDAVLSLPFAAGTLPPGFTATQVSSVPPGPYALDYNAAATIQVELSGPDDSNALVYEFYGSAADGRARFQAIGPTGDQLLTDAFRPADFDDPARCFSFSGPIADSQYGVTFCLALVGSVVTIAGSARRGEDGSGDVGHAVALARSAVEHLRLAQSRLTESGPSAANFGLGRAVPEEDSMVVPFGTPLTYRHRPPTSGPHYPALLPRGVYLDRQDEGYWVHSLARGYVAVLYNCPRDCPELVAQLAQLYLTAPHSGGAGAPRLLILPYRDMDHRLAAVAWNRIDELEEFDAQRLVIFIETYQDQGPEDAP